MTATAPSVAVVVEAARRRVFVSALEWPGLARSGKTEELAVEAFLAAAERYRAVAARAGESFPISPSSLEVVEYHPGNSGTEFGVPSAIAEADRRPCDASEAARLAALVAACWEAFAAAAAIAPTELRKGPRGGGRDRDKMIAHVVEADAAYARVLGLKVKPPAWNDGPAVAAMRQKMLEVLRQPSNGEPIAGKKWPQRYAARYIAWHALDHAWEMEARGQ